MPAAQAAQPSDGVFKVTPHAFAYRPPTLAQATPVVVLLHGAGGDARRFLEGFRSAAGRHGVVLLAPQSAAATWEVMPSVRAAGAAGSDSARLAAAIDRLAATIPVDRRRIILLGFSDGASYALTLGLANPAAFRGIVALSPGFARAPATVDPAQRIFIAHGRRDEILPFDLSHDVILPGLVRLGLAPRARWFDGGHRIDAAALDAGLAFVLEGAAAVR